MSTGNRLPLFIGALFVAQTYVTYLSVTAHRETVARIEALNARIDGFGTARIVTAELAQLPRSPASAAALLPMTVAATPLESDRENIVTDDRNAAFAADTDPVQLSEPAGSTLSFIFSLSNNSSPELWREASVSLSELDPRERHEVMRRLIVESNRGNIDIDIANLW